MSSKSKKYILVLFLLSAVFVFRLDLFVLNKINFVVASMTDFRGKVRVGAGYCKIRGGEMQKQYHNDYGHDSAYAFCFRPYFDAGKSCQSSSDCQGGCKLASSVISSDKSEEKLELYGCVRDIKEYHCNNLNITGTCVSLPKGRYSNCGGYWVLIDKDTIQYVGGECGT